LIISFAPIYAQSGSDLNISAQFGTEALDGFTQYELKFIMSQDDQLTVYGHSRLKFPFTSYFAGGALGAEYHGFDGHFGFWTNYSHDESHIMTDLDWLTTSNNEYIQLAIGKTMIKPKMYFFGADFGYNFHIGRLGIRPFFKYSYYHSEFTMRNLTQYWYYNTDTDEPINPPQVIHISGDVLFYRQNLQLPIIGSSFNFAPLEDRLELFTNLGATFLAAVSDSDQHLIRDDSLTAKNTGDFGLGILAELGARYNIYHGLWINAEFGYSDYRINTNGSQRTVSITPEGEVIPQVVNGIDTQVRGLMRRYKITFSYEFPI